MLLLKRERIVGVDEAGRGPLAGPVVAAACYLPSGVPLPPVRDSKMLSPLQRERLFEQILSLEGVDYGIGMASVEEIEEINILQATFQAMLRALQHLRTPADYVLVDGPQMPSPTLVGECVVRGDRTVPVIAAASILAKVTRDKEMERAHAEYPHYGFAAHKGYGTRAHLNALRLYGPCPWHRKTFRGVA